MRDKQWFDYQLNTIYELLCDGIPLNVRVWIEDKEEWKPVVSVYIQGSRNVMATYLNKTFSYALPLKRPKGRPSKHLKTSEDMSQIQKANSNYKYQISYCTKQEWRSI